MGNENEVVESYDGEEVVVYIGNEEPKTIQTKPITIICKSKDVGEVTVAGAVVLDPMTTVQHGQNIKELHPFAAELVLLVMGDDPQPGMALQHVVGLMDLTVRNTEAGKKVQWRYPETYLHPAQQCQLADAMIKIIRWRIEHEG